MRTNLAMNVDAVNQVQLVKLALNLLDAEEVAFVKIAICFRERLGNAGILAFDQTFDASVFDNVHERFECATMIVNRIVPTFFWCIQCVTIFMTNEHIVHVTIHILPDRKIHCTGSQVKRGSRNSALMNNVDILTCE